MAFDVRYGGHPDEEGMYHATETHWNDFMGGVIWGDIKAVLADRKNMLVDELTESGDVRMKEIREELKAIKNFLIIPQHMLEALQVDNINEQENEDA